MMKTVFLHCCCRHEVKWKWGFQWVWLSSTCHTNNHKWLSSCTSTVEVLRFHSFCFCLHILCKTYGRVPTSHWFFKLNFRNRLKWMTPWWRSYRNQILFKYSVTEWKNVQRQLYPDTFRPSLFRNATFCWLQIHNTAREIINTKSG
jgi:hypothetical protein